MFYKEIIKELKEIREIIKNNEIKFLNSKNDYLDEKKEIIDLYNKEIAQLDKSDLVKIEILSILYDIGIVI